MGWSYKDAEEAEWKGTIVSNKLTSDCISVGNNNNNNNNIEFPFPLIVSSMTSNALFLSSLGGSRIILSEDLLAGTGGTGGFVGYDGTSNKFFIGCGANLLSTGAQAKITLTRDAAGVGIGTVSPNAASILDLTSTPSAIVSFNAKAELENCSSKFFPKA